MKKAVRSLAVALLVTGPTVHARAQTTSPHDLAGAILEDLLQVRILVASTKGDDIFTTPSTVSVIDAATLQHYNIESIAEALSMLPGINVASVQRARLHVSSKLLTLATIVEDEYDAHR
jgi:outer membrane receptor for ferrienterochelin and colicin